MGFKSPIIVKCEDDWEKETLARTFTREFLVQKYKELKDQQGRSPLAKEFYTFVGVHQRKLQLIYGDSPYSKLQAECGDHPNKLELERTPIDRIMRQYGDLAVELKKLPSGPHWTQKGLKPTVEGLTVVPHLIKWSEMPSRFRDWLLEEKIDGYTEVLEWIKDPVVKKTSLHTIDPAFAKFIVDLQNWSPARRRNSEESYKVELRMHLKSHGYSVNEEFGESDVDLLIDRKFAIETKKAPNISEYDRLFGQIARHLQHGEWVVAVIMDVPREDQYQNFLSLVDAYLNKDGKFVEVMKK